MTIEMSIGMTVRRKIIEISKTRDMREGLKTIIKTGAAGIKIGINIETGIEMTAMIWVEVGLERSLAHIMKGRFLTDQN